jgi:hypothetical protein
MRLQAVVRIVAVGMTPAFAGAFAAAKERPKAEIVPQLGHSGFVMSVVISPDGKTALHHGDSNGNGLIDSELVAHVQAMVPKLAASGEARAAVPRGAASGQQSAHFGTTGGDFALVNQLH